MLPANPAWSITKGTHRRESMADHEKTGRIYRRDTSFRASPDEKELTPNERVAALRFILGGIVFLGLAIYFSISGLAASQEVQFSKPTGHTWSITQTDGWHARLHRKDADDTVTQRHSVLFEGTFHKEGNDSRRATVEVFLSKWGRVMLVRRDIEDNREARMCSYLGRYTYEGQNFDTFTVWDSKQFSGELLCTDSWGFPFTWIADIQGRNW